MTPNADTFDNDDATDRRLVLGDLVNRVLDKGVVISGQVMISIADVDLVSLDLRLILTSVQTVLERSDPTQHGDVPLLRSGSAEP
jgi:hypothetical protein